MGLVIAGITLSNCEDIILNRGGYIKKEAIRNVNVKAIVNCGAFMLEINENIRTQLGLPTLEKIPACLPNGTICEVEIVGPVEIRFKNRRVITQAIVLPGDNQVILGKHPLSAMDVVIDLKNQELLVNPEHPDKAQFRL